MISRFQSSVVYIQLKISSKFMSWTTSWYFKWGIEYQFDHINHFDWTAQTPSLECTSIYFIITYYELEKLVRDILTGAIFDQIASKGMTSVATSLKFHQRTDKIIHYYIIWNSSLKTFASWSFPSATIIKVRGTNSTVYETSLINW